MGTDTTNGVLMAATVRKTTAGVMVAGAFVTGIAAAAPAVAHPGDDAHPWSDLHRTHASGDEAAADVAALANRGPGGLPWLAGTSSVPVLSAL
ncbi:hypothetical protein GTY65_11215 [Streptomyces sp. SID8379]|uniref:hypothetical protein n=1 Tax=unclassified Streptomyces TaxID=2593676 RepID=UPI001319DCB4|nr:MULTISPECIES: hypothetical protein [unclassified Streptomyces]MYW64632.1 hypothetical protein [Streptomyces sp. SID8379]